MISALFRGHRAGNWNEELICSNQVAAVTKCAEFSFASRAAIPSANFYSNDFSLSAAAVVDARPYINQWEEPL